MKLGECVKIENIIILSGLLLTCFNIAAFFIGRAKDIREYTRDENKVSTDLEIVRQGNSTILIKLDKMDMKMDNMQERLVRVEESTKQAHRRLDEHLIQDKN
jgi:hypothetical protein